MCLLIIIKGLRGLLAAYIGQVEVLLEDNTAPWEERPRNEKSMKEGKKCIVLLNTLLRASGHENIVYYSYTTMHKKRTPCSNLGHLVLKFRSPCSNLVHTQALDFAHV